MTTKVITIFGGSGFIGRHLVRALARRGHRIRVAVRRPDLAGHLQPLGSVGQIQPIQANLRDRPSIAAAVDGADAVINLVGILAESGRQSFDAVQAKGPKLVAEAVKAAGVASFVQMSAIGANAQSDSDYAMTKARGEEAVKAAIPEATIVRPSIVFGPEDNFFNQFASLATFLPALPLIGGGHTRFQPVFVGDVAEAIARIVDGEAKAGLTYELGGPDVMTFREVLEFILKTTGRKRLLINLPFSFAAFNAGFMEMLPNPMLTRDQVRLLASDNIVSPSAAAEERTLEGLGIAPASVEAIVPAYLYRFRKAGQFERKAGV